MPPRYLRATFQIDLAEDLPPFTVYYLMNRVARSCDLKGRARQVAFGSSKFDVLVEGLAAETRKFVRFLDIGHEAIGALADVRYTDIEFVEYGPRFHVERKVRPEADIHMDDWPGDTDSEASTWVSEPSPRR